MDLMQKTGTVIKAQRYSIHDGNGVRTTIFLSNCKLRCKWCSNPESWNSKQKLAFYEHKCIACNKCVELSPRGLDPRTIDRVKQDASLFETAVNSCPKGALEMALEELSVADLLAEVMKDSLFFRFTGGGVTFSGGEPFLQHEFLDALSSAFYDKGVNMAVETCGYFDWKVVAPIVEKLDHVFFDLKHMDSGVHRELTGVGNEEILENSKRIHGLSTPMTIRIPCIKGANFTKENIIATAKFMSKELTTADIELLPYHDLGKGKYQALGMDYLGNEYETPNNTELEEMYAIFEEHGIKKCTVFS